MIWTSEGGKKPQNKIDRLIITSDFTIKTKKIKIKKNTGNLKGCLCVRFCLKVLNMGIVTLKISDFDGNLLFPTPTSFSNPVVLVITF